MNLAQSSWSESAIFHLRHAWFNIKEQFSDVPATLASNALIPFFVWMLSKVWERFNAHQKNFTIEEIVIYIAVTELLFMTFVRLPSLNRASGDFSIALARPRAWPAMSFSGLYGRSFGSRVFMILLLTLVLPLFGANIDSIFWAFARLFILLPWLGVLQALFALFFATAQLLWHQTNYFLLPFGKIFLVLGGVWGPIADFAPPWKDIILKLPPSDLFFQPAYFCVKGTFYNSTSEEWFIRTAILAIALAFFNTIFFKMAKKRHQSFGG
ncbi:MAG: hypothetical protein K2Q18_00490 [Bdellovibrionales bacterium]|nr:hypothetical protein [Bdellovibrionales bacterium]